jgi:hypothetical protein
MMIESGSAVPTDIIEASRAAANLPDHIKLDVSRERQVIVSRLSWLKFEAVWADLAGLLAVLAGTAEDAGEEELLASLASAPQVVLKLAELTSGISERELADWPFDDVLVVAAAAIKLNFIDSAGVRDFSSALGKLADLAG